MKEPKLRKLTPAGLWFKERQHRQRTLISTNVRRHSKASSNWHGRLWTRESRCLLINLHDHRERDTILRAKTQLKWAGVTSKWARTWHDTRIGTGTSTTQHEFRCAHGLGQAEHILKWSGTTPLINGWILL